MENNVAKILLWRSKVRDYECDQGFGVSNAVFMSYLQQARHEFLLASKIDFAVLAKHKIGFVLLRAEVDYRRELVSGEEFFIETKMERLSKRRFQFVQYIYTSSNKSLVLESKFLATAINEHNKSEVSEVLEQMLIDFPIPPEEKSIS